MDCDELPGWFRQHLTIDAELGCWLWDAPRGDGYAVLLIDGAKPYAHRYAYEYLVGAIPDGLVLYNGTCYLRHCVNPAHWEPVTLAESGQRASAPFAAARRLKLAGQRFGSLTAIEEVGSNERGARLWRCACDCGAELVTEAGGLKQGNVSSCGCVLKRPRPHRIKTHCKRGHELAGENLYYRPSGSRACRACKRARSEKPPGS